MEYALLRTNHSSFFGVPHIKMENLAEMYTEEATPSNEIRGFTKSFQKRTKDKKAEDVNVTELLGYQRANKVVLGAKVTEKKFKNGSIAKVFASSNCDELTLRKARHYAKLAKVDVVVLDIDSEEVGQKLAKRFFVSMVGVLK